MIRRNEVVADLLASFPVRPSIPRKSMVPPREMLSGPHLGPVGKPPAKQTSSPLIAWIGDRRKVAGDEPKKVLRIAALRQFPDLKEREFNAAYGAIYKRKRGRPRKTETK
jgi:hypothetical protein